MSDPVIKIKFDYSQVKTGTREVLGDLGSIDKGADGTEKKFKSLEAAFERLGIKANTLAGRSRGAATGIRILSNSVYDLLGNLKLQSNTIASTNKDIVNMKKALSKTGATVIDSAEDFNKLATSIDSAGNKAVTLARRSKAAGKGMRTLNNAIKEMVDNLQDQIEKLNAATKGMNKNLRSFNNFQKTIKKGTKAINENSRAHDRLNRSMRSTTSSGMDLQGIFTGLITIQSVRLVIEYADAWTKLTNNIRIFTNSEMELIKTRDKLFEIAQKTRTELSAQTTLYNRLKIAQSDLGISETGVLKITEAVGYALGVTSTTALEARGSLIQLGQAFGSGIVRAEEFNSINEGTPKIMQAISKALGLTRSQLRTLVLDGKVQSEDFANALITMSNSLKEQYEAVSITVGMSLTKLKNSLTKVIGDLGEATGVYENLVGFLNTLNILFEEQSHAIIGVSAALMTPGFNVIVGGVLALAVNGVARAFLSLNAAMLANPAAAISIGFVTLAESTAYVYSNMFGAAAEADENMRKGFKDIAATRSKFYGRLGDEKSIDFFKSTKDQAASTVAYLKGQLNSLTTQLTTARASLSIAEGDEEINRAKNSLSGVNEQINKIKNSLEKEVEIEKILNRESEAGKKLAEEKNRIAGERYAQLLEESELKRIQLESYQKDKREIIELKQQLSDMAGWEKYRNDLIKRRGTLGDKEKKHLEYANNLLKGREAVELRLEALLISAGKGYQILNIKKSEGLTIAKRDTEIAKEKLLLQKKILKLDVAAGIQAKNQIAGIGRSGYGESEFAKKILNELSVIVGESEVAKTSLREMGVSIPDSDRITKLANQWKEYSTKIGIAKTSLRSYINEVKGLKKRKRTLQEVSFEIGGLDAEGLALLDKVNRTQADKLALIEMLVKKYPELRGEINKLNEIEKSDIKIYGTKKKKELELTEIISNQTKTRYQIEVDAIKKKSELLKKQGEISVDLINKSTEAQIKGLDPIVTYINSMEDPIIAMKNVFVGAFETMEDSLVNFVKTGKFEWQDFVVSVIDGMLKIEAQRISTSLLSTLASSLPKEFSGIFSKSAKGDVFNGSGLQAFASGGTFTNSVVSSPTMFAHGGGFGVMGEAGDEAILPLSRTSKGNLGVEATVSQPNVILNVENNTGQDISAEQVSSEMVGTDMVLSIVLAAASNNNAFKRNLQGALNR